MVLKSDIEHLLQCKLSEVKQFVFGLRGSLKYNQQLSSLLY